MVLQLSQEFQLNSFVFYLLIYALITYKVVKIKYVNIFYISLITTMYFIKSI